jgi:hypothetical protein
MRGQNSIESSYLRQISIGFNRSFDLFWEQMREFTFCVDCRTRAHRWLISFEFDLTMLQIRTRFKRLTNRSSQAHPAAA